MMQAKLLLKQSIEQKINEEYSILKFDICTITLQMMNGCKNTENQLLDTCFRINRNSSDFQFKLTDAYIT